MVLQYADQTNTVGYLSHASYTYDAYSTFSLSLVSAGRVVVLAEHHLHVGKNKVQLKAIKSKQSTMGMFP